MTALWIVLGILLLFALLLAAPVSLRFSWNNAGGEALRASVHYLCFRLFDFSPEAGAKKAAGKGEEEIVKEDKHLQKKEKAGKTRAAGDTAGLILEMIKISGKPLNLLRRHLVFYRVRVYGSIAAEDAHQTAVSYTKLSGVIHTGLGLLSELFCLRRPQVYLAPDFAAAGSRWDVSLRVRIRPAVILAAAAGFFLRFLKVMYQFRKDKPRQKKGGKKHEPATSRQ